MLARYRILKCTDEQLAALDRADIIGMRKGRYANEVLTLSAEKYPDYTADVPTIEEIMVYYVKQ